MYVKTEEEFRRDALSWLASTFGVKNSRPPKCRVEIDSTYFGYGQWLQDLGYVVMHADNRRKMAARHKIVIVPTEAGWDYAKLIDL